MCWYVGIKPSPLLGVDYVNFASQYDKVCEWNYVGDVIVFVPGKNGICTRVSADEAQND